MLCKAMRANTPIIRPLRTRAHWVKHLMLRSSPPHRVALLWICTHIEGGATYHDPQRQNPALGALARTRSRRTATAQRPSTDRPGAGAAASGATAPPAAPVQPRSTAWATYAASAWSAVFAALSLYWAASGSAGAARGLFLAPAGTSR